MVSGISRRHVLQGAVVLSTLRYGGHAHAERAQAAAVAGQHGYQVSKSMIPYIGSATSRVDGRAKVTGAAKYAGEFNTNGLAYGSVVTSSIAKGRIARIDASEALRVDGVIDVL